MIIKIFVLMSTYYQLDYPKHELMMFIDSKQIRRVSYKG